MERLARQRHALGGQYANSVVKRSVFLDDLVYSIASNRVKVQRMGHFGTDVADIASTP